MKCKNWDSYNKKCSVPEYRWNKHGRCPKYDSTDSNCNVLKDYKPRMVRVKAWGFSADGDKLTSVCMFIHPLHNIPCTILCDKKYLRGGK